MYKIYLVYAATQYSNSLKPVNFLINIKWRFIVKKVTKSLIEELNSIATKRDNEAVIESRAAHIINSAINLLSLIRENYSQTDAGELERRFLNSIRGSDANKFTRGIRKMRDNKK